MRTLKTALLCQKRLPLHQKLSKYNNISGGHKYFHSGGAPGSLKNVEILKKPEGKSLKCPPSPAGKRLNSEWGVLIKLFKSGVIRLRNPNRLFTKLLKSERRMSRALLLTFLWTLNRASLQG